ncbi:protein Loquacious-like [Augochlora pura]
MKSAVSILQENLMKNSTCLPVYTEVSSEFILSRNRFTIQCTWNNNYRVKGHGSTKKEAKQDAAKEMIALLTSEGVLCTPSSVNGNEKKNEKSSNLECNSQSSMNSSNSAACSQELFVNYVGSLMEFCVAHQLPVPSFDSVSTSGLPHNFIFTMNCTVGSLCKQGSGNTKKVAKQNAAKEVLQTLKASDAIMVDDLVVQYKNLKLIEPKADNEIQIRARYQRIKNVSNVSSTCIHIGDYHLALMGECKNVVNNKEVTDLELLKKKCYIEDISVTKTIIKNIFNVSVETFKFKSKRTMQCIVAIKLNTVIPICQIGSCTTFKEAEQVALANLLQYIILFVK